MMDMGTSGVRTSVEEVVKNTQWNAAFQAYAFMNSLCSQ